MHKMGDNSQMRVFFLGMIQGAKRHLQREVICGKKWPQNSRWLQRKVLIIIIS